MLVMFLCVWNLREMLQRTGPKSVSTLRPKQVSHLADGEIARETNTYAGLRAAPVSDRFKLN